MALRLRRPYCQGCESHQVHPSGGLGQGAPPRPCLVRRAPLLAHAHWTARTPPHLPHHPSRLAWPRKHSHHTLTPPRTPLTPSHEVTITFLTQTRNHSAIPSPMRTALKETLEVNIHWS